MSFKSSCIATHEEQAPQQPLSHPPNFSAVYVAELHVIRTFNSLPSFHSKEILLAPKLEIQL